MHKNALKIVGGVKFSKKNTSKCGGTKIWDFQRQGGDFRHSGFGHTDQNN